jgi:hypothetical protein
MATVAVIIALGGTSAYAAGLITGKDVQDESLTGADIQNGSVEVRDTNFRDFTGVREETGSTTLHPGEQATASAFCQGNEKAVGGGWETFHAPDPRDVAIRRDTVTDFGWEVTAKNVGGIGVPNIGLTVTALCLRRSNAG